MTEITLKLDDPAKTAALLRDASAAAGSGGCNHTAGMHARWLAEQIEEQVKPTVEEPQEFASVVMDRSGKLWVRLGATQPLPWGSGEAMRDWAHLDAVEVLRVGIGEPA
jgi:hypothetical protein